VAELKELVATFCEALADLRLQILEMFPPGCVVRIGENWAIVVDRSPADSAADHIPLEFENGNVWWKHVLDIRRSDDRSRWPSWIATRKRRKAAFKGMRTRALREQQSREMDRR